jgi:hypothetical protein
LHRTGCLFAWRSRPVRQSLVLSGFINLVCRHLLGLLALGIGVSQVLCVNRTTEHQSMLWNKIHFSSRIETDNLNFREVHFLNPAANEIGKRGKAAELYTHCMCVCVCVCVCLYRMAQNSCDIWRSNMLLLMSTDRHSAVGIATRYDRNLAGARFSALVQTAIGVHPACCKMGTGYLSRGKATGTFR